MYSNEGIHREVNGSVDAQETRYDVHYHILSPEYLGNKRCILTSVKKSAVSGFWENKKRFSVFIISA